MKSDIWGLNLDIEASTTDIIVTSEQTPLASISVDRTEPIEEAFARAGIVHDKNNVNIFHRKEHVRVILSLMDKVRVVWCAWHIVCAVPDCSVLLLYTHICFAHGGSRMSLHLLYA